MSRARSMNAVSAPALKGTRDILGDALGYDVYDRFSRRVVRRYEARVPTQAVDVKDGGREILELTRALRIPVALATSTATELARTKLRLAGLLDFFAAVIGGDVSLTPSRIPEPYLTAAAALGHAPNRCWAVEDSDNGVRAAHAAGLLSFRFPTWCSRRLMCAASGTASCRQPARRRTSACRAFEPKDCDLVSGTELSRRAMISPFVRYSLVPCIERRNSPWSDFDD